MIDPSNVVRLTPERRERADRQRALASAYRLEAAVAHIPADLRPAVVQAVAKALQQERPDAFRHLPWPWCERLLEWWDLRIRNKVQGAGRRAVADFAVITVCGKQHPSQLPAPLRMTTNRAERGLEYRKKRKKWASELMASRDGRRDR
jgi:hypothetical protein